MRSVCVCLCVCHVRELCQNESTYHQNLSPSGSHIILVFSIRNGWRYSNGEGGVEFRWGRQKTRFWTNIWLRCIQVYSVVNRTSRDVWKTKPRRTEASVEHSPKRPSSIVRTIRRRSVCDGRDVIRRRRRKVKAPMVITPVFGCRRIS